MEEPRRHAAVNRLTALWALSESGLGGWLFALKIPLTGALVGGFAVLLISLIAWYSKGSARTMLSSLVLVLLIKATVSPHSPLPAYLAVSFQGLMGVLLFRAISGFRFAALLLGMLAMLESAFQKIITLTLIFGNALWEAVNQLWKSIVKDFSLSASSTGAWYVIGIYGLVYLVWGTLLGVWAGRLPALLERESKGMLSAYHESPQLLASPQRAGRRNRKFKWLPLLLILIAIVAIFLLQDRVQSALYVIIRSVAVTLALYVILLPLGNRLLHSWTRKAAAGRQQQLREVMDFLPVLRSHLLPVWQFCGVQYSGLRRYRNFILLLIIITLQSEPDVA